MEKSKNLNLEPVRRNPALVQDKPDDLQLLEKRYALHNREEILGFLVKHRFLAKIIIEAYPDITRYFPYSSPFLELFTDPESAEEAHLTIFVPTNEEAEEAFEKFDELFYNWWLKKVSSLPQIARGKLNVNLALQ